MKIRNKIPILTIATCLLAAQLANSKNKNPIEAKLASKKPEVERPFKNVKGKKTHEMVNERILIDIVVTNTIMGRVIKDFIEDFRSTDLKRAKIKLKFLKSQIDKKVGKLIFECGILEDNDGLGGPFRESHQETRTDCNWAIAQMHQCYPRLLDMVSHRIQLQETEDEVNIVRSTAGLTGRGRLLKMSELKDRFGLRCRHMISEQKKTVAKCSKRGIDVSVVEIPNCSLNIDLIRQVQNRPNRPGFGSIHYR